MYLCSQRDYEEYKVRINALVAKAQKTPEEGWIMQDGTPWPGNNPRDHPGMIQVVSLLLVKYQHVCSYWATFLQLLHGGTLLLV